MALITYLKSLRQEADSLPRMIWLPLLLRGAVLLLCSAGCYVSASLASHQGHFPKLENVAAFKPVRISPAQSTCGIPERSTFCQPGLYGLRSCPQQFCIQGCQYRSSTPPYVDLFSSGLGTCVTEDVRSSRPGSAPDSASIIFWNKTSCFASPPVQDLGVGASFTITVWLKPKADAVM